MDGAAGEVKDLKHHTIFLHQILHFVQNDREGVLYQILHFVQNDRYPFRMTKGRMTMKIETNLHGWSLLLYK